MQNSDIYRVTHALFTQAQLGLLVSHWIVSGVAVGSPTDQEAAAAMDNAMSGALKALTPTVVTYRGAQVQKIFPLPVLARVFDNAMAGAGTVVGDLESTQTSGLFKLTSALAGRHGRGRKYMPFPGEADSDASGNPSAGYLGRLGTLATLFGAPVAIPGVAGNAVFNPLIFNKKAPASSVLVSGSVVRNFWATQRRRGALGRPNTPPF